MDLSRAPRIKISVKVKANTSQERIEKIDDTDFIVWIREKPVEGKANGAVIRTLAEYFGVAKSNIVLLKGKASKHKIFEINPDFEIAKSALRNSKNFTGLFLGNLLD
jgi:uncharacterized protein